MTSQAQASKRQRRGRAPGALAPGPGWRDSHGALGTSLRPPAAAFVFGAERESPRRCRVGAVTRFQFDTQKDACV